MKMYHLKNQLPIKTTQEIAWRFLSNPKNLGSITPKEVEFKILNISKDGDTYAGQIIEYTIRLSRFMRVNWVTEITHCQAPNYFIDEQRFGPYKFWHHQHWLSMENGHLVMHDEITYAMPFGWIGRLAHYLFIGKKIEKIFNYRNEVMTQYFKS